MGYYTGKPSNRLYGFAVMQDFTTFFILFSCRLCFLTIKNTNALPDYKVLGRIASSWNGNRSRGQHALLVVKIPDWIFHPKKVKCLRRNKCKRETLIPLSLSGICSVGSEQHHCFNLSLVVFTVNIIRDGLAVALPYKLLTMLTWVVSFTKSVASY